MRRLLPEDEWFQKGRMVGLFGASLAWFILGTVLLASIRRVPVPQYFFPTLSLGMVIMSMLSVLVLVALASEHLEKYDVGPGAKCGIAASFIWLLAAYSVPYCFIDVDEPVQEKEPAKQVPHGIA